MSSSLSVKGTNNMNNGNSIQVYGKGGTQDVRSNFKNRAGHGPSAGSDKQVSENASQDGKKHADIKMSSLPVIGKAAPT